MRKNGTKELAAAAKVVEAAQQQYNKHRVHYVMEEEEICSIHRAAHQ